MRLSRLHINGFKSFPDRAELGFDGGVTAIVGPNGCGKSNVVDAIKWVLGEQSAKSLRGERMEDVIFNGSDARKPTAAAEVRLKLTNVAQAAMRAVADVDALLDEPPLITRDIEIGRRLYRSGRERVPDRRRGLPAAGRPRPADGFGTRRESLRRDRAGEDRTDSVLAPRRAAGADRGSRRGDEVQIAPAGR